MDIWKALEQNRLDVLQDFLKGGTSANKADGYGRPLLAHARSVEAIQILKEHAAYFRHLSVYRETPLHMVPDDPDMVRELVSNGVDINERTSIRPYMTALAYALSRGRFRAAEALIDLGARLNPLDGHEKSPLAALCSLPMSAYRSPEEPMRSEAVNAMLERMLEAGADPNPDCFGMPSPLELVVRSGNLQGAEMLLRFGARVTCSTIHMAVAAHDAGRWADHGWRLGKEIPDDNAILEMLLGHMDRAELASTEIYSPMYAAVRKGDGGSPEETASRLRMFDMLVRAGAPLKGTLLYAKGLEVTRWLLERGADPDESNLEGFTAAHFAAENGEEKVLAELIRHGACPDAREQRDQDTPLMCAARNGHRKCVEILLDAGADPDLTNRHGQTAAELAKPGLDDILEKSEHAVLRP